MQRLASDTCGVQRVMCEGTGNGLADGATSTMGKFWCRSCLVFTCTDSINQSVVQRDNPATIRTPGASGRPLACSQRSHVTLHVFPANASSRKRTSCGLVPNERPLPGRSWRPIGPVPRWLIPLTTEDERLNRGPGVHLTSVLPSVFGSINTQTLPACASGDINAQPIQ
jgi:hypothetical protein